MVDLSLNYDVDELREAADLEPLDELEDFDEPTHKCQSCGWPACVNDHKRHAPNFCNMCQQVRTFIRLEE